MNRPPAPGSAPRHLTRRRVGLEDDFVVLEGENAMQLLLKHILAEPVPPSVRLGRAVPPALEQLMMRCLAKAPADRPSDAVTVAEGLGRAGADEWTQRDARS